MFFHVRDHGFAAVRLVAPELRSECVVETVLLEPADRATRFDGVGPHAFGFRGGGVGVVVVETPSALRLNVSFEFASYAYSTSSVVKSDRVGSRRTAAETES